MLSDVHIHDFSLRFTVMFIFVVFVKEQQFFSYETTEHILQRTLAMTTSDELLLRYVSFELTIAMLHCSTDDMRKNN